MNGKWASILQVFSNLAILAGLILVIWELQQSRILARAQLASDGMGYRIESFSTLIEGSSALLAKACLQPDELTPAEKMELSLINDQRLELAGRVIGIEIFSNIGLDWEVAVTTALTRNFQNQYGRDYYSSQRHRYGKYIRSVGDDLLSNIGPVQCKFM